MRTQSPAGEKEVPPGPQPRREGETVVSESWDSPNDRRGTTDETCVEEERGDPSPDDKEGNGRERLKRHRSEVAGRVWIPDVWGQEEFLKDWVDCTVFDSSLVPSKIMSAKAALVEEGRRASPPVISVENRC